MHRNLGIATLLVTLQTAALAEGSCKPPPIADREHAICVASEFVNKPLPPAWEVEYAANGGGTQWRVEFYPRNSNVRGGGGELLVDKASGKVAVVSLYR